MNYRYTFGTHYQNEADASVVLFRSGRGETHASTRPRPDALLPTCQAASVAKTGIETRPRQNPSSANCSVVDGAPEGVSVTCDRTASLCMPKIFADTSAAAGVSSSGRKPVPRKMPMLRKGGIQVLVLSRPGGLRGQKGWLRRLAGGLFGATPYSGKPARDGSLARASQSLGAPAACHGGEYRKNKWKQNSPSSWKDRFAIGQAVGLTAGLTSGDPHSALCGPERPLQGGHGRTKCQT